MRGLLAPILKSTVFIVITAAATAVLALTITNGTSSGGHHYNALFTDATSLNVGDDVRIAGVRVGQVTSVSVDAHERNADADLAKITFTVESDVALAHTVSASIRYRNLIGQRYLELDEGTGSLATPLPPGATLSMSAAHDALDLTALFNGFQPLFRALEPKEINELSGEIIAVFQREGPTVDDLLTTTASLTTTLAAKDQVIGQVIDNLNAVLTVINARRGDLSTTITTLQRLVTGLASDRVAIGQAVSGIAGLTIDVGGLLARGRAPLAASIDKLGTLSANLAGANGALNTFLTNLPTKLSTVGRVASYGSWLNFYLCSVGGRIPVPGGYYGGVGVQPEATRCS